MEMRWLLRHAGRVDQAWLGRAGAELRRQLEWSEEIRHRAFGILVELTQNLTRCSPEKIGLVTVCEVDGMIRIRTGNGVTTAQMGELRRRLNTILTCGPEELAARRKARLHEPGGTESGGAGLGFFQIALWSNAPLWFAFVPIAGDCSFFSIEAAIRIYPMQSTIHIPATEFTPQVSFDAATETLTFEGESYPENVSEFYRGIHAWIHERLSAGESLKVVFRLTYLNTSSTKALLDLLQLLEQHHKSGRKVEAVWEYKRHLRVMLEAGEEIGEGFGFPYRLEAVD